MIDAADHQVRFAVRKHIVNGKFDAAGGRSVDVHPAHSVLNPEVPDRDRAEAQGDGHGGAGLVIFRGHDGDLTVFFHDAYEGLDTL